MGWKDILFGENFATQIEQQEREEADKKFAEKLGVSMPPVTTSSRLNPFGDLLTRLGLSQEELIKRLSDPKAKLKEAIPSLEKQGYSIYGDLSTNPLQSIAGSILGALVPYTTGVEDLTPAKAISPLLFMDKYSKIVKNAAKGAKTSKILEEGEHAVRGVEQVAPGLIGSLKDVIAKTPEGGRFQQIDKIIDVGK